MASARNACAGVLLLTLFLLLAPMGLAQEPSDPFLDTWKLNASKSKFDSAGGPKKLTVRWEKAGAGVKVSHEGVDAKDQAISFSYVAFYDGKEYPPNGPWNWDTVVHRQADSRHREDTFSKAGKVIGVEKRVVSEDGKTLTIASDFVDSKTIMVFDRQ